MKIYLDFNESLECVKVKLEGGGTVEINTYKKEHKEALTYELVNLILEYTPRLLEFTSVKSDILLELLGENNVFYDENTQKLTYNTRQV